MAAFVLAVGLILIAGSTCHVAPQHGGLDAAVRAALWDFKGSVGIYAEDFDSGRIYGRNEDHLFPAASVFKVPVMIEFFRRVESIELITDQTQEWAGGISRHGSGVLKEREPLDPLPLLELCRLMIAHSDNIATDTLMQLVSAASVSATMDELGFPNTHVGGELHGDALPDGGYRFPHRFARFGRVAPQTRSVRQLGRSGLRVRLTGRQRHHASRDGG